MESSLFLGIIVGAVFGGVNLYTLKRLAGTLVAPRRYRWNLVFLLLGKFGLLYPAAGALLYFRRISAWGFLIGFTVLLAAAAFQATRISLREG